VPVQVMVAASGDRVAPSLLGSLRATEASVEIHTVAPARLPLEATTDEAPAHLRFILTVAEPERVADATLTLGFEPAFVEQASDAAVGDAGHVSCERLKFVLPGKAGPLQLPLGRLDAPVPARGHPAAPVPQAQRGTADAPAPGGAGAAGSDGPLSPHLRWSYAADLALPGARAQDDVWVDVAYSLPLPIGTCATAEPGTAGSLFEALAAFVVAWLQLRPLLAALPERVESGGPAAAALVAAALERVRAVLAAWDPPAAISAGAEDPDFPRVAAAREDAPPAAASDEYVLRLAHAFDATPMLQVFARAPFDGVRSDPDGIVWPRVNDAVHGAVSGPLPAAEAPNGGDHWFAAPYPLAEPLRDALELVWPALDVLARQTGRASSRIVRNAAFASVPGRTTNPALVYRTAEARFDAPVMPVISVPRLDGFTVHPESLCQTLYDALRPLGSAGVAASPTRLLEIAVSYAYEVVVPSGEGSGVWSEAPVLLAHPQLAADSAPHGDVPTLAEICASLAGEIHAWYAQVQPESRRATLSLRVVLFAEVDGAQLPVIRLEGVALDVPPGWWGKTPCS
jgi:hypothetical protein